MELRISANLRKKFLVAGATRLGQIPDRDYGFPMLSAAPVVTAMYIQNDGRILNNTHCGSCFFNIVPYLVLFAYCQNLRSFRMSKMG